MNPINLSRVSVAMTRIRLFACCVVALALGCKKDATFSEPIGDFASITWANLVPDTGQLDTRVIDIVSNAGLFRAPFRSALIYPTGIEAGTRRIKVFLHSDNPDTAKMFLVTRRSRSSPMSRTRSTSRGSRARG